MSRKMFLVLSLLVVLSLGGMGMAYTLWSDNFAINGTVSTGIVDANMTLGSVAELTAAEATKNIGSCAAVLVDGPLGDNGVDTPSDGVQITISNGYPGYVCEVHVGVANVGTIPVKLTQIGVTSGGDNTSGNPNPKVTVTAIDCWDFNYLLEPGGNTTAAYSNCRVYMSVNDDATENTTYTFGGTFMARQWNLAGD